MRFSVKEGQEFDIYPVGLLKDLIEFDYRFHMKDRRLALRMLWKRFKRYGIPAQLLERIPG